MMDFRQEPQSDADALFDACLATINVKHAGERLGPLQLSRLTFEQGLNIGYATRRRDDKWKGAFWGIVFCFVLYLVVWLVRG